MIVTDKPAPRPWTGNAIVIEGKYGRLAQMKGKRIITDLNRTNGKPSRADRLKRVVILELDIPAAVDGQEPAGPPAVRPEDAAEDSFEEHAGRMEAFRRSHAGFR